MTVLLAWLGNSDFRASEDMASNGAGPILGAARARAFTAVHLLSDYPNMVVRLLSNLRQIPNFNPDILITKLRESRWFL